MTARAVLAPRELRTLAAVCDALLPEDPASWREGVADRAAALLAYLPNPDDLSRTRLLLRLLELPPAGLALAGRWAAFGALPRGERVAYLGALSRHPVGMLRGAFQALKRLAGVAYYADADASGSNPVWARLGYPGPLGMPPAAPKTIRPLAIERDTALDCDAVVIGSGAGGGVVAGELAAAGFDVIVLEAGLHRNEADFDQLEVPSLKRLYYGAATTASGDQGVILLAGSCLGGGTVVNYTTSFRTPPAVRAEWAASTGLDLFAGADFSRALDAVCERLSVNQDHDRPSARDAIMARGLAALGWQVDRMPRDVQGCAQDDRCGYCGFGCAIGAKRSMLRTYLQDAFDRGARIVVECAAERVVVERGRATGVRARTRAGHLVTVRTRAVVVAAGALNTPALLLRSGIGGEVGRHLRLHPITAVWAHFAEAVRPWTGTIQALYSDQFADLDAGYGVKFETAAIHPAFLALAAPWEGPEGYDHLMRELPRTSLVGVLLRDRYGGRVTVSRTGAPVVQYAVSRYDQRHVRQGVAGAARVLLAAGATDLYSMQTRHVPLDVRRGGTVEEWLSRVDRAGYGANRTVYATFHQMGTCRMSGSRAGGVTGADGQTHAVRDLYVADGSLFPSASGVNPMITIAALAHHVAQGLKAKL